MKNCYDIVDLLQRQPDDSDEYKNAMALAMAMAIDADSGCLCVSRLTDEGMEILKIPKWAQHSFPEMEYAS